MRGKIRKFTETSVLPVKYHLLRQSLDFSWIIWDSMYLVGFFWCADGLF